MQQREDKNAIRVNVKTATDTEVEAYYDGDNECRLEVELGKACWLELNMPVAIAQMVVEELQSVLSIAKAKDDE